MDKLAEMATSTTTPSPIPTKPSVLGHESDWWNGLLVLALAIAAIGAVATLITTQIVISLQRREAILASESLARYKAEAAQHIADARQEGIRAGREAGDANARAAEANAHAAEAHAQSAEAQKRAAEANERAAAAKTQAVALEKDAATAKLEQERLKASVVWRTLDATTENTLEHALAEHPGSVNLWYVVGDPESLFLAIQFDRILERAHWTVAAAGANLSGIVFGIALPDPAASQSGIALSAALQKAGVEFGTGAIPPTVFTGGANKLKDAPVLMIGSKRPPLSP